MIFPGPAGEASEERSTASSCSWARTAAGALASAAADHEAEKSAPWLGLVDVSIWICRILYIELIFNILNINRQDWIKI